MIKYTDSLDSITADQLIGFFVGWPNPPSPATHLRILDASAAIELAIDTDSGRVVGFMNALTDSILCVYFPLLEILPEYQHKGIGTELTRRMLERFKELYMADLLCDTSVQPFYERLGIRPATGAALRQFDFQSGRPE